MNSQGVTEFEPSTEWVHEDDCETLLLYLPGFVKEHLRVQLRQRTLIISGQRKLQDNTWTRFRKEFLVPEHCDINKINAKFEGSILYVKQPKLITPMLKQEEKLPMNSPTTTTKNPIDESNKPTSMTQSNGKYGDSENTIDGAKNDLEEKDENYEEKVKGLKEPKSVCENASKKMVGGSDVVMKLKPLRNDVIKVLAFLVGFVVGVYCTKSFQSWIG